MKKKASSFLCRVWIVIIFVEKKHSILLIKRLFFFQFLRTDAKAPRNATVGWHLSLTVLYKMSLKYKWNTYVVVNCKLFIVFFIVLLLFVQVPGWLGHKPLQRFVVGAQVYSYSWAPNLEENKMHEIALKKLEKVWSKILLDNTYL